tara:strand:+ start:139 stop:642 length:504 start_codon:yes stop_codon:yes gene_type:complete
MSNPLTEQETAFEKRMDVYMLRLYVFYEYGIILNGDKKDEKKDITLLIDGKIQLVEHKYRYFPKTIWTDILVEIMQDMKSHNLGWLYKCGADRLYYVICQGEKNNEYVSYYYDIDMREFKAWFFRWIKTEKSRRHVVSLGGYGITLNIAPPISVIPEDIIKKIDYDL